MLVDVKIGGVYFGDNVAGSDSKQLANIVLNNSHSTRPSALDTNYNQRTKFVLME